MCSSDLTAARYRIPVILVVFSDSAFGNVRRMQQRAFGRTYGTELHNPDFLLLAKAFGVAADRVHTPDALKAAITAAVTHRGPVLIEVPVSEMPSPWHLIHAFSPAPGPVAPNPLGEQMNLATLPA